MGIKTLKTAILISAASAFCASGAFAQSATQSGDIATIAPNGLSASATGSFTTKTSPPGTNTNIAPVQTKAWPSTLLDPYSKNQDGVPVVFNPGSCGYNPHEITITIKNLRDDGGLVVADLFGDNAETFLDGKHVLVRVKKTAIIGDTQFCIPVPGPGEYAVSVYHDKNNNDNFDKGFLSIPKETFGMSTNPEFGMSAPTYDEAKFTVGADGATLEIKMLKASDIL